MEITVGAINRLATKSRVSSMVLTNLLGQDHFRYSWIVDGGSVSFEDLFTEGEWSNRVVSDFRKGRTLVLQRRLGPYVPRKGRWMLKGDVELLESGTSLEKAVVNAANNSMENGDEDVLESKDVEAVAADMMDCDADIEKLTSLEHGTFTQKDVIEAIKKWRSVHEWEDFSKMPA